MKNPIGALALLLAATFVLTATPVQAEIAYHQNRTLVAAITDGSDPFGDSVWDPLRPLPEAAVLNPDGASRGDGRPDIAWDAEGIPYAVWAYKRGNHHDIAFSYWAGEGWSPMAFLDTGPGNALDPRVHVDDAGTVHVAWWEEGSQLVYKNRRPAGTDKWLRPSVAAVLGKRPSLASFEGTLRVVFEVALGGPETRAIAIVREGGIPEIFSIVEGEGSVDPVIHSLCGKLWVDYKASNHEMGVLVLQTDSVEDEQGWFSAPWSAVEAEPWEDPSWIGVEFARRAIQLRVLTLPPTRPR